jgi:hypothetical protein
LTEKSDLLNTLKMLPPWKILALGVCVCALGVAAADASSPKLASSLALPLRMAGAPSCASSLGNMGLHACLSLRGGGAEPVLLEAEQVLQCDNLLGEAPMYNSEEHALYWLDINGQKLWKFAIPDSGEIMEGRSKRQKF